MATWVRAGTGTAPSATNLDLVGDYALDNATAPADFDPAAVTSVRCQWTITGSGFSDDSWDNVAGVAVETGATEISQHPAEGSTTNQNVARATDHTDSTGIPTGLSTAQWEAALVRGDGTVIPDEWCLWNKVMGPDGSTLAVSSLTVTITYTPAVAGPNEGSASGSIGWVGSASGAATHEGASSGAVAWVGSADGSTTHEGSSSGAVDWVGSADGVAPAVGGASGTASGAITWAGSADGSATHEGASSGAVDWVGSATGVAPAVGGAEGSASGAIAWAGSADGAIVHEGASTGAVDWVGSADGEAPTEQSTGTAAGSIVWAGSAAGQSAYEGAASGAVAWVGSADGQTAYQGSASGSVSWVGTATGSVPVQASGRRRLEPRARENPGREASKSRRHGGAGLEGSVVHA